MTKFYLLRHVHVMEDGEEDVKFMGVYSSKKRAQSAVSRLGHAPGFSESPNGFHIDEYQLDKDQWIEGFSIISHA